MKFRRCFNVFMQNLCMVDARGTRLPAPPEKKPRVPSGHGTRPFAYVGGGEWDGVARPIDRITLSMRNSQTGGTSDLTLS